MLNEKDASSGLNRLVLNLAAQENVPGITLYVSSSCWFSKPYVGE